MSRASVFASRLRGLFSGRRREDELEHELRFHLEMQAEDNQRAGMEPTEARYAAARNLGSATRVKEQYRERSSFAGIEAIAHDLRFALRAMRKNPAFATTAVLSLALGIGANTAIFSLIDALMLRSLPVSHPEQLVQIVVPLPERLAETFSYPMVRDLAGRKEIFAGLAGCSNERFTIAPGEVASGAWVSGGYYETLGLEPRAGRLLNEADDQPGAPPVAVISDGYWARKFGRNPDVVGKTLRIESAVVTIVGVSPPGFDGMTVGSPANITMAIAVTPQVTPDYRALSIGPNYWSRQIVARLRDDIPLNQAKAQAMAKLAVVWPALNGPKELLVAKPDFRPAGTGWTELRGQFQKPLLVLIGIAGLVLLIACANLANLLLARATARQREIGVRLAIGAGRGRIVRQLLTESALVACCGAGLAIVFAWFGSRGLVDMLSAAQRNPILLDVSPNSHAMLFTSVVAFATVMLFGLAPAFRATADGPAAALKNSPSRLLGKIRLAPALVVVQVALSLLLLIGAGLFVRTLENLRAMDPGFRRDGLLFANLTMPAPGGVPQRDAFYLDLLERARELPGVVAASFSSNSLMSGGTVQYGFTIPGFSVREKPADFDRVGPGYFAAVGTPVLEGREFTVHDGRAASRVAVVNEAFTRLYLSGGRVLGRHIAEGRHDLEIVGEVKDARAQSLREPVRPAAYVPIFQSEAEPLVLEVHAGTSVKQVASELRSEFHVDAYSLDSRVEKTLIEERLMATLAGGFGCLALILASVGLYGMLAYSVSGRTHEVGIRVALGARQTQVVWLVMRDALQLMAAGVILGLPGAWAVSRLVSSMLFGLTPEDPRTITFATAALVVFGLLAAFLPARRAAQVDPMVALRNE